MSSAKKALVIDDEEGLVSVLTMFLEDLEIEVSSYESVDKFLTENSAEDVSQFTFMVVDHNLPGTKGLDFVCSLAADCLPQKVILTSGEVLDDERLGNMSCIEILNKPFDFNSLEGLFVIQGKKEFFMMSTKRSILIIEDEPDLAGIMKDRFDEEGFLTVTSGSRVEMLMKMRNQEFDCIVCDLNIKGSAGGDTIYNIIKTLEGAKKQAPIILVSGNIDMDIMKDYGKEVKAAFVKPVNMDLLLQKVHDLINK